MTMTETAVARIQRAMKEWADCRPEHPGDYSGEPIEIRCAGELIRLDHQIGKASTFPCNNSYGVIATWASGVQVEFFPGFRRFSRRRP